LTVLTYKVDIIAECGAHSYRPCVLRARQGRSILPCCLVQEEPADLAVPAGESACRWWLL